MACVEFRQAGGGFPGAPQALRPVDLTVPSGEMLVLAGPPGSGKSLLLQMLAGTQPVGTGEIFIDGEGMAGVPAEARGVAAVYRNSAVYPHMTVYKNITYALKARRVPPEEMERQAGQAVRLMGLGRLLDKRPAELTETQRLRVALARAVAHNPRVYLLDDVLAGPQRRLRGEMRAEITRLHRRLGATFLCAVQDAAEMLAWECRTALLCGGALQQVDAPAQLLARPQNLFVAEYASCGRLNAVPVTLAAAGGRLCAQMGEALLPLKMPQAGPPPAALAGRPATLVVYPEDIHMGEGVLPGGPAPCLDATLQMSELAGSEVYLNLVAAGGVRLRMRAGEGVSAKAGDRLRIAVDTGKAHLFDAESGRNLLL